MESRRAWLLDASIYIFRAWFSMPDRWHSAEGMPLNAVYGYARFLCDFIALTGASPWLAAAFDESLGSCFRNELYPDYKSSRELPDDTLAFQLQACRTLTQLSGIPCYGGPRYEADDYLATLSRVARERSMPVTVVTRDKDLGQLLLGRDDRWLDVAAEQTLDAPAFEARFGVSPARFADYLGLVGDAVDDIPGVPGVGPKTAAALIASLGDLEKIHGNLDTLSELPIRGAQRIKQRLVEHWPQALLSRQLARLEWAVPGIDELQTFTFTADHATQVTDYLVSLGLEGPLVRRWQRVPVEGQRS